MSRARLPRRADCAKVFRGAFRPASSASGTVFRLHVRRLVHQRGCPKHFVRVKRHRDGGDREECAGALRPRN